MKLFLFSGLDGNPSNKQKRPGAAAATDLASTRPGTNLQLHPDVFVLSLSFEASWMFNHELTALIIIWLRDCGAKQREANEIKQHNRAELNTKTLSRA